MTIAKFGKLEHLQELKSGVLFMNGINYFRELETKERGDASDGKIKQFQAKISIEMDGKMKKFLVLFLHHFMIAITSQYFVLH